MELAIRWCDQFASSGTSRNPARTCQDLKDAGHTTPGTFYVGPVAGRAAAWHCDFSGATASGYSWGDGKDGNVNIAGGVKYITECEDCLFLFFRATGARDLWGCFLKVLTALHY